MTLNIELSPEKVIRLKERAKLIGVSPDEFARKVIEFIADTPDDEFESWLETLEILLDKEFAIRLMKSIKQAEEGRLTDWQKTKVELGLR
jgi:hypothetical protein